MTVPVLKRRRDPAIRMSESSKAKILLAIACCWPLAVLLILTATGGSSGGSNSSKTSSQDGSVRTPADGIVPALPHLQLRNIVDRVDIMGYGPTHPRVAIAIVGDNTDALAASVESVFRTIDLNRLFVVTVVVDGKDQDDAFVKQLQQMEKGSIPHWHGLRADIHFDINLKASENVDDEHGRRVHVLFNPQSRGVAESRADAVEFIKVLQKYHEDVGLKSLQEDIILVLMRGGAQFSYPNWLGRVTEALIVPPPIMSEEDEANSRAMAMKLANAVSFNVEGPSKRTGFDATFTRTISEATAADLNLSSGDSYPTPALNGAAVAMRLDTYLNLPLQDLTLADGWVADIDLALNLWLCADGIDMLRGVDVTTFFTDDPPEPVPAAVAARMAAAWMDEVMSKKLYNAYTKKVPTTTYLEWQTHMSQARESPSLTKDLVKKCRSFKWYVETVNTDMSDLLAASATIIPSIEKRAVVIEPETVKDKEAVNNEAESPVKVVDHNGKNAEVIKTSERREERAVVDIHDEEDFKVPDRKEDLKKPSMPLCNECLEIIQKAKLVDISYVDVSDGHKEHPHKGATDENGNFGYVHDETALRRNPPSFTWDELELNAACTKRDNNYRMLTERVFVDFDYDKQAEEEAKSGNRKRPKIFCFVYTIEPGHSKIPLIQQTWGPKCDGFMVASNKTDVNLGTVNIPHEGPETYNNIWQKVRSMWSYIYDNYYTKYDYFHIGGDDLFLIVENLRYYLESEEIQAASNGGIYLPEGDETMQTPLFLGRRFAYQGDMNNIFNSGGSGYTLNKAALKLLVTDGFEKFFPHKVTFSEDTMIARILKEYGVYPYETKDSNGGERYNPFMPGHHYGYRLPADHSKDWYAVYSINIKEGPEHCSPRSVAFHYVKGDAQKRLFAILYKRCPPGTLD